MANHALWFLENINVEHLLCPNKMDAGHMDKFLHRNFKKGDYIYLPNEHSDKMYFLTQGRVKIGTYGESGKEITKAILGEGEVFGELAVIGEETRRDFAYVMEDAEMCVLSIDDMRSLMRNHNSVAVFMMRILGNRTIQMERRLESMVFRDSRTRIVEYLHDLALRKGRRMGYEYVVYKFITHQEIANLTATSRQTVTTVLNELRSAELITFDRRRLIIRDMDALKKQFAQ